MFSTTETLVGIVLVCLPVITKTVRPSEDTASVLERPKSPFDSSAKGIINHGIPCGLVVRIQPSHGCGRGSIPRMGSFLFNPLLSLIIFYYFLFVFTVMVEPPATSEPDVNPELQALEHVLSKAHKVRAECTTAVRKPAQQQPKVSFAASMRLATSVYNRSGKKAQPSKTHSHKKKSSEVSGKKQRILPAIVPASVSKVASEQRSPPKADTRGTQRSPPKADTRGAQRSPPKADTRGGSRIKDTPADTRGGSRIKDTPAQLQGEEYCHTLKTHG